MINIDGLNFSYSASSNTLNNLSLTIEKGTTFGLLGPNGAGKSTLLNILTGLLPFQSGSITINGQTLQSGKPSTDIALVPQELAFYPKLTGYENLIFFAQVLGLKPAQIKNELERCIGITQLEDHLNKRAVNYSGGLKRRLNLAIGLLGHPAILFLDEPTVGIDAQSRNFLLDSIKSISELGTTIIYTSHYMEEVESLCDKIAIIDQGEIKLEGQLKQILQSCESGIATITIEKPLSEEETLKLNAKFGNSLQINDTTLHLDTHNYDAPFTNLIQSMEQFNQTIKAIDYGHAKKLEQLFLDLTSRELRD
jgi:ABC-2 type transport system ATP-binding protein